MRLSLASLLPLAVCSVSASVASDAFGVVADVISGNVLPNPADSEVHIMDSWRWVDCGLPSDAIDAYASSIEDIQVSPDPPKPGKNLTVTVTATANERIEEGAYADVTVKLGLIKLLQKRFDVCDEARGANASIQCPVEEGHYKVEQTVELPKEIPKAKFVVNVRGYTADDDDMVCLDLIVDFMQPKD